jgi:hypothetical protein
VASFLAIQPRWGDGLAWMALLLVFGVGATAAFGIQFLFGIK